MSITEKIKKFCIVKEEKKEQLEDFLAGNNFLIPIIEEAHAEVKKVFADSVLYLDIYDSKDGREIGLLIETKIDSDEAVGKLIDLDNDWWMDTAALARGKLFIDLVDMYRGEEYQDDDELEPNFSVSLAEIKDKNKKGNIEH